MAESLTEMNNELVFLGNDFQVFKLEDMLTASAKTLGKGTFGYTYVVHLEGRADAVAIKSWLNVSWSKAHCISEMRFVERAEQLGRMVHENLLPLRAYSCHQDMRRLVYDYMPLGSLSSFLHGRKGVDRTVVGWEILTKIAYGVSCGINFLHSQSPDVCHGNIRSSNVLLTDSYDARLSESGIAQLVSSKSIAILAAGYRAPEVKYAYQVSQQADVYSFGVVLLELLIGQAPKNSFPEKRGVDLPRLGRLMFQEKRLSDVLDYALTRSQKNGQELVLLLQLAICCTFQYPNKRPLMSVVTNQIKKICGF